MYYEVKLRSEHGETVRFIKYDLSCALEAVAAIIIKTLQLDESSGDLEIEIYKVSDRGVYTLEVHTEV